MPLPMAVTLQVSCSTVIFTGLIFFDAVDCVRWNALIFISLIFLPRSSLLTGELCRLAFHCITFVYPHTCTCTHSHSHTHTHTHTHTPAFPLDVTCKPEAMGEGFLTAHLTTTVQSTDVMVQANFTIMKECNGKM